MIKIISIVTVSVLFSSLVFAGGHSKGGHYLTNKLLKKVFENSENFSIIEIKERNLPHTLINSNLLKSIA